MSELHSSSSPLYPPEDFPARTEAPRLKLGDRVRFIPMPAEDFGVITGIQYAPAEHLQNWAWRYTIWLDLQSPSRAWTCSDFAWEDELELLMPAPVNVLAQEQSA